MRKIEKKMVEAVQYGHNWHGGNTMVADGKVYLHGNHIATCEPGKVTVNVETLKRWPTPTTKSRLRALGVDVSTKDYDTFIEDIGIWDLGDTYTVELNETYYDYLKVAI